MANSVLLASNQSSARYVRRYRHAVPYSDSVPSPSLLVYGTLEGAATTVWTL